MSEIIVPEIGESVTEGTIAKWIVKEGDSVQQGDMLLELETDKVNLEISAEQSGVIAEIRKQEGNTVQVGEVIGLIGSESGQADDGRQAAKAQEGGENSSGQRTREGERASGDQEKAGSAAVQAEPAKAPAAAAPPDRSSENGGNAEALSVSPSARKLAREKGIDLNRVPTADPAGRIFREDVRSFQSGALPEKASSGDGNTGRPMSDAQQKTSDGYVDADPVKPVERIRMSRRRITIANRLVEAQKTAAMLTTFNEVDMTAILDLRKRRKDSFKEKHDVGLGFMSFFTKAVVGALKAFPLLNAEIDGDQILAKKYYDIGIAVSAKEGLVVPVVRDADRLGFAEIEKRIAEMAAKARSNSLALSDLQGGTFTITNGGVFGSLLSTPILNTPQVGILGMHKIQLRPIAIDAERSENRPMMYIALSYDHRIVDGSEAVRFLVMVKELLEDPESLLLEG